MEGCAHGWERASLNPLGWGQALMEWHWAAETVPLEHESPMLSPTSLLPSSAPGYLCSAL